MKNKQTMTVSSHMLEMIQEEGDLQSAFDAFIHAVDVFSEVEMTMTEDEDHAAAGELAAKYESLIADLKNLKAQAKRIKS